MQPLPRLSCVCLLACAVAGCMHTGRAAAAEYSVDSARTVVTFEVRRFGFLSQSGWFEHVTGRASLDPQSHAAEFDLVIDAASVRATDSALTSIVRGKEFLDVARYPEILYRGQQLMLSDREVAHIDGSLTMHGVTGPLSLVVTGYDCASHSSPTDVRCVISASGSIRRSRFDMNSLSLFVADRVKFTVHAELAASNDRASTPASPWQEPASSREALSGVPDTGALSHTAILTTKQSEHSMQPLPHSYLVAAAGGTSGNVSLTAADVPSLSSAAPSQFGGPGDQWSPESLLCAAIASCFILSFRAVARASALPWVHLDCEVEGVLERSADVTRFTRIVLRAVLTVVESVSTGTCEKLLSKAEHGCLIANSLNCSRELQFEIVKAPAAAVAAG